ncbi:putative transport protein particle component Bet3 [Tribonema minus]|uniref:Trafficking protein particle complex subunit n=1 Tax=Tribonema minus TaxID=303371 RepID=A0A835ZIA0_9STRA|nr:putative transport protein particle component Bet3 [Tribonema minus]
MATSGKQHTRLGEQAWNKMSKVNAEFFALTYGAMVMQLVQDFEDTAAVNAQLDTMGYNIGVRLIDEFLAKSGTGACADLRDTAETIAKVAFKMFLGVVAEVANWNADGTAFSVVLYDNPLIEFVELPPQHCELLYSNVLCGVIRGALEMVQMKVECRFARDVLRGDDLNEIRVELKEVLAEQMDDQYFEGM